MKTIQELLNYKTVNIEDNAFHLAVSRGNPQLVKRLLGKVSPTSRLKALLRKNVFGFTALHKVANANPKVCVELARELVQSLQGNDIQKTLISRNNLGETPLYKAAAIGQTNLLQYWAYYVDDLSAHFHRYDRISILHIAIVGQNFGK